MPTKSKGDQGRSKTTKGKTAETKKANSPTAKTKKAKTKKAEKSTKTQGTRARAKAKDARVEGDVGVKKETVVVAVAPVKQKKKTDGTADGGGSKGGRMIAAALGVAAAAAAGVAAYKTFAGKQRKVFHLMPHEEGWQVTRAGEDSPEAVHDRKRKARSAARDLARANEPSQLVIHRADGTIQTVHTYGT